MLNMTQKQWVENILIENGKITRNTCLKNYISRLGAIIAMLKEDGYEFDADYIEVTTPFGKGKDFEYKVVSYPAGVQKTIGAEKVDKKEDNKINNIAIYDCVFCKSTEIAVVADVTVKDDIQINHWYMECQECSARGSKSETQNDAIFMWNRTPQHLKANQGENLFDIEYVAYNTIDKETHTFKAQDDEDAKHWIINHLDLSKEWSYKKFF